MNMRTASLLIVSLALTACGARGPLVPVEGEVLPVAPHGEEERPTSAELMEAPTQGAPKRSVELRRRSEEREEDPFDLPPES